MDRGESCLHILYSLTDIVYRKPWVRQLQGHNPEPPKHRNNNRKNQPQQQPLIEETKMPTLVAEEEEMTTGTETMATAYFREMEEATRENENRFFEGRAKRHFKEGIGGKEQNSCLPYSEH